jgi:hypothetical protein
MQTIDKPDAGAARFGLRVLQVDLARQLESLGQLRAICDFAAAHGYNALGFYLEDRVKTPAYPDSPDEESYSPEQMREIIAYADERGLEVIPVVSTLGHTERFLRHPRLRRLAEGRDGAPQRMGDGFNCVCPSLEESLAFWKAYLGELAEFFPSPPFSCRRRRSLESLHRIYIPSSVVAKRGVARGAEHTFVDDSRWCWMGDLSTTGAIASMSPPPVHSLELMLAEGSRNSDGIR